MINFESKNIFNHLRNTSGKFDFRRIFHNKQRGLGSVMGLVAKDLKSMASILDRQGRIHFDASIDGDWIDAKTSTILATRSSEIKKAAFAFGQAAKYLEKRILGGTLSKDEKSLLRHHVRELREARASRQKRNL